MTTSSRTRMARADRRDQLLEAAQDVFLETGYVPSSMDDVADRAGVTKPVLYDHFGSKDGLLAAVVEKAGQQMLDATMSAIVGLDPHEALRAGLTAYFSFVDANAGAWTLLISEVAPGTPGALAVDRIRQTQVDAIAALIGLQLSPPDPVRAATYAHVVSGAAERLSTVRLTGPRTSPEDSAALLLEVLWTGFGTLLEQTRVETA